MNKLYYSEKDSSYLFCFVEDFLGCVLGALLFMFKLTSGKGATFEAVGHNGASATNPPEGEELHNVQRLNSKPGNTL